jgi:hypothetical protein
MTFVTFDRLNHTPEPMLLAFAGAIDVLSRGGSAFKGVSPASNSASFHSAFAAGPWGWNLCSLKWAGGPSSVGATSAGYAAPDGALIYSGDAILQGCRAYGAKAGLAGA